MRSNAFRVRSGSSVIQKLRFFIVSFLLKNLIRIIAKIDDDDLKNVPAEGPLLIAVNHINFLEVPILQLWFMPRKLRGFVKKETWDNPVMAFLFNTYRAIPVDRGGINKDAFREIRESLSEGYMIVVAPEGTRSGNGILSEGKQGLAAMALMTGTPILPVVHYGGQDFWENFKHFRRTPLKFKVGKPFNLKSDQKPNTVIRESMTREVMYQMAQLLPEELRGSYSDKSEITADYLDFLS